MYIPMTVSAAGIPFEQCGKPASLNHATAQLLVEVPLYRRRPPAVPTRSLTVYNYVPRSEHAQHYYQDFYLSSMFQFLTRHRKNTLSRKLLQPPCPHDYALPEKSSYVVN